MMRDETEGRVSPHLIYTLNMCIEQVKFVVILYIFTNDGENTRSIDLGIINKFLASRQIHKYRICEKWVLTVLTPRR